MTIRARARRPFVLTSLALATVLSLSVFGPAQVVASRAAAPVKLVFWHHNDPSWIKVYKHLAGAYHSLHPNVTIVEQTYGFSDLPTKLQTVAGTSSAPDIVGIFGTNVTAFARSGKFDAVPASIFSAQQMQSTFFLRRQP